MVHENEEKYLEWLNGLLEDSTVTGGKIKNTEDILVLNTCDYSFEDARILIIASRVK